MKIDILDEMKESVETFTIPRKFAKLKNDFDPHKYHMQKCITVMPRVKTIISIYKKMNIVPKNYTRDDNEEDTDDLRQQYMSILFRLLGILDRNSDDTYSIK